MEKEKERKAKADMSDLKKRANILAHIMMKLKFRDRDGEGSDAPLDPFDSDSGDEARPLPLVQESYSSLPSGPITLANKCECRKITPQ